jgi:hypothetical protein
MRDAGDLGLVRHVGSEVQALPLEQQQIIIVLQPGGVKRCFDLLRALPKEKATVGGPVSLLLGQGR